MYFGLLLPREWRRHVAEEGDVGFDLCPVEGDLATALYVCLGVDEDRSDGDDGCKSEGELKLVHGYRY